MINTRIATPLRCAITVVLAPLMLYGCGGGGSKNPATDARSAVSDTTSNRSVKLNNYNNWHPIVSDGESGQGLELTARRDNICMTEAWGRAGITVDAIKAINPQAKIYSCYCLVTKCPWDEDWNDPTKTMYMQTPLTKAEIDTNDWWLRDGNGEIVKETDGGWFLDVGKPGFKEAYTKAILERNAGKGFDGIVFDIWYPSINSNYFAISGGWFRKFPMPKEYLTDDDWFNNAWKPFIEHLSRELHKAGYRVIGNCVGQYNDTHPKTVWQRSQVDGVVYEQWVVDWDGKWLNGDIVEKRMNAFNADPLEVWTGDYGLKTKYSDYDRKTALGLAMYYIAVPQSGDRRSYHHYHDAKIYWLPIWDFNIGTPAEAAQKIAGKYFWSRKYSKGLVLMNYEASGSITYNLSRKYRDPEGKILSGNIKVAAHTGLILAEAD